MQFRHEFFLLQLSDVHRINNWWMIWWMNECILALHCLHFFFLALFFRSVCCALSFCSVAFYHRYRFRQLAFGSTFPFSWKFLVYMRIFAVNKKLQQKSLFRFLSLRKLQYLLSDFNCDVERDRDTCKCVELVLFLYFVPFLIHFEIEDAPIIGFIISFII